MPPAVTSSPCDFTEAVYASRARAETRLTTPCTLEDARASIDLEKSEQVLWVHLALALLHTYSSWYDTGTSVWRQPDMQYIYTRQVVPGLEPFGNLPGPSGDIGYHCLKV